MFNVRNPRLQSGSINLQERLYQEQCIAAILADLQAGIRQLLVVMATGTGKTVVFSKILKALRSYLPGKVLIFAHREELVDQAVDSVREWNPELKVGKEMASDWADTDCDVIVSCVASIGRSGATRLQRFGEFDVIICDEAHHSIASTYLNVFETTGVLKPDSRKLLLGFTATPKRKNLTRKQKQEVKTLDEENILSLKSVYKKISYTYPIRKAIKDGWLVPLKGFRLKTDVSLDDIKTTAGDYQQDELAETVNTPKRNQQIVKSYIDMMAGRQAVGFTVDIAHAKALASAFCASGIKAEAVWGVDPERKAKLERHQNKKTTVLFNAQVLTEGYDDWRVSCIILCAPTKNPSKFTQEVGRGTRLQKGTGNLLTAIAAGINLEKLDCYILDVVDNSKKNSLVTFPSLLGLNPEMDLHGEDVVKVVEQIEELEEKFPGVDFTKLVDLKDVQAYIESIDIFAAPYTEEVKEFSELTWMATADGAYVLAIPEKKDLADSAKYNKSVYGKFLHEKLHIAVNELEEYELSITSTETERKLGTFNSLQEAFTTADDVIRRCRPDRIKVLKRDATWHNGSPSEPAKKYLKRLMKKKPMIWCLCPGHRAPEQTCPTCGMKTGITAGMVSTALNKFKHAS